MTRIYGSFGESINTSFISSLAFECRMHYAGLKCYHFHLPRHRNHGLPLLTISLLSQFPSVRMKQIERLSCRGFGFVSRFSHDFSSIHCCLAFQNIDGFPSASVATDEILLCNWNVYYVVAFIATLSNVTVFFYNVRAR